LQEVRPGAGVGGVVRAELRLPGVVQGGEVASAGPDGRPEAGVGGGPHAPTQGAGACRGRTRGNRADVSLDRGGRRTPGTAPRLPPHRLGPSLGGPTPCRLTPFPLFPRPLLAQNQNLRFGLVGADGRVPGYLRNAVLGIDRMTIAERIALAQEILD